MRENPVNTLPSRTLRSASGLLASHNVRESDSGFQLSPKSPSAPSGIRNPLGENNFERGEHA